MTFKKIISQHNIFKFKNLLLFFCFFYLILSINSPFYFYLEFKSFSNIINFLRGISPFIVFLILVIFLKQFKKDLKFDLAYFLFFLYLLFQFSSFVISGHDNLIELYWPFCGFVSLLLFFIIKKFEIECFFFKIFFNFNFFNINQIFI